MTEEQIDVMTFKDNKLTHWLKPLLTDQEGSKIAVFHHIHDDVIEEVLQQVQVAVRIKSVDGATSKLMDDEGNPEDEEYKTEMLIQELNKENFDLRNQIESFKRSHKSKLEEAKKVLQLPCDVEFLIVNKN